MKNLLLGVLLTLFPLLCDAQNRYELNSDWKCLPSIKTKDSGASISKTTYSLKTWQNATVPGTVLTTMLVNKEIPDPFYGMNNKLIPDIYDTGSKHYTYWFVKEFTEIPKDHQQVWLTFRGINYSCEIYLNGYKVNTAPYEGMFLRKTFNISSFLSKDGKNRLAVIVYPPNPVGKPGGQGGDGEIARNVSHQYVAGWDWIQPIRDRNTGIWDKVYIEKTASVNLSNPHVVTLVPGKRKATGAQADAVLKVSAELENATNTSVSGTLQVVFDGETIRKKVTLAAHSRTEVALDDYTIKQPKLWWPSGYGDQYLYPLELQFIADGSTTPSDIERLRVGVREIQTEWNTTTRSKQILVNGQKIFIKGGNWIISDAMLRFTPERYLAEIRYHRDMNLNLIRIWGGALTERPEFYEACDQYGMLVIQDFWMSGDCNGRWLDPAKLHDQWVRRSYPDNHPLFIESAIDMIKMIRNYPSLAVWCGGNEITPPEDILRNLRDTLLPKLDGTRWFIDYSNSDEMSYNAIGGNGDGPYGIQDMSTFWDKQTFPFNSEVGSVGVGDYASLARFIPSKNLLPPVYKADGNPREVVDSVWTYHHYIGYDKHLLPYGAVTNVEDFANKAQLVNYNQYRALMEGFSSHMWEWYTGTIIWKTQNPWTAMRGQMYDYYLDPNACLFGLRKGSEALHVMCNPVNGMIMVVNNGFEQQNNLMVDVKFVSIDGKTTQISQNFTYVEASSAKKIESIKKQLDALCKDQGGFLYLELLDDKKHVLTSNFYWYPDASGMYSGLNALQAAKLNVNCQQINPQKIAVTLSNSGASVAFFNRISLLNSKTKARVLPVFYDDNYVSVLPGQTITVMVEHTQTAPTEKLEISVQAWNFKEQIYPIK